MSVEITEQKTEVVFTPENETILVSMHCKEMSYGFSARIWRKDGSLLLDSTEIKENLYDLINGKVEQYFRRRREYSREVKLLNFEKLEDDLLKKVENAFCKGEILSLSVEYEFHLHKENLFECKDCG